MKINCFLLIAIGLTGGPAMAQHSNEVVKAELAFADIAKAQTMKKAFLANMDSTAVVFEGATMRNGFEFWNKAREAEGKLLWHPVFFGSSRSGDLGFTTGPWEFRPTLNDSAVASGQYTTVWKKNRNGEWKFLIDLGVDYRSSLIQDHSLNACAALIPADKKDTSVFNIENKFISEYSSDKENTFLRYLHPDSWLNTSGKQPIKNSAAIILALTSQSAEMIFQPVAGGMSSARDLAYVYGTIQYKTKKENYLRIWGHTGEGWKILLQVIKQ